MPPMACHFPHSAPLVLSLSWCSIYTLLSILFRRKWNLLTLATFFFSICTRASSSISIFVENAFSDGHRLLWVFWLACDYTAQYAIKIDLLCVMKHSFTLIKIIWNLYHTSPFVGSYITENSFYFLHWLNLVYLMPCQQLVIFFSFLDHNW